jgi:hypothetical protein
MDWACNWGEYSYDLYTVAIVESHFDRIPSTVAVTETDAPKAIHVMQVSTKP